MTGGAGEIKVHKSPGWESIRGVTDWSPYHQGWRAWAPSARASRGWGEG